MEAATQELAAPAPTSHERLAPSFPDYSVSESGIVVRMFSHGTRGCGASRVGCVLLPRKKNNGYLSIHVRRDNKSFHILLHKLVAETYLGPRPVGHTINHKNGNKTDNRACNLEYVTAKANTAHAVAMGLVAFHGEANPNAKLSLYDKWEIRRLRPYFTRKELSNWFGVSLSTITYTCK